MRLEDAVEQYGSPLGDSIVIYGLPTTGKSFAISEIRKLGYTAVDTDEVIEEVYSFEKWWAIKKDERDRLGGLREWMVLENAAARASVIFTNFHVPTASLFFSRRAASLLAEWEARGSSMDPLFDDETLTETLTRWATNTEKWILSVTKEPRSNVFMLPTGEYMFDAVLKFLTSNNVPKA